MNTTKSMDLVARAMMQVMSKNDILRYDLHTTGSCSTGGFVYGTFC